MHVVFAIVVGIVALFMLRGCRWSRATALSHWRYGFDRKVTHKRKHNGPFKTDCSGFVSHVLGYHYATNSWDIVKRLNCKKMYTLNEADMRAGTVIAYDSGPQGFDENRDNGVDHVGIVLRGWDFKLYLCDCKQKYGVRIRPLHEGVLDWNVYALEKGFGTEYMSKFGPLSKAFYVGHA